MSGEVFLFCLKGGVLVFGCYGAAAFFHEGGHALLGRIAGGNCLWIRLGRILWVPGGGVFVGVGESFWRAETGMFSEAGRAEAGKRIFVRRKSVSAGAGECVLSCPSQKSLLWAALGGPFANLASAAAAGAFWYWVKDSGKEIDLMEGMAILLFLSCSLLMAFLSLFFRREGEENDGSMVRKLCHSRRFCRKMQKNQQKDLLRLEFGLVEEMF